MFSRVMLILLAACSGGTTTDKVLETGGGGETDSDSGRPDSVHTGGGESGETSETSETSESAETGDSAVEPDCALGTDSPTHVSEGDTVSLSFLCDGVLRSDLTLEITGVPDGAAWDAETWTLTWETGLSDAQRYPLQLAASNGATLDLDLWVSDAFWDEDNVPVDADTYELEDGLPVLHLDVAGSINSTYDTPATLVYRGHTYEIAAQYRGASSYYYPQKSFTLKFEESDKFDDDEYGWGKAEDLILLTTFDDNLYMRNALTYWLWGQLDEDNMTPRTFFAVVYLEGEFWGLYEVIERINDEFYEDRGLNHDGELFMGIDHNANFYATDVYGATKSTLYEGYEKKEGTPEDGEEGAYDDVASLVSWAVNSTEGEFRTELDDVMVANEIYDWFILVTFAGGWDSGGKNQLVYYDPETEGPWRFVPWDFNASWGQQWETSRVDSSAWDDFTWTNNLFYRSLNDELLARSLWTRYRTALEGPLRPELIQAQMESWQEQIDPSSARTWRLWAGEYYMYSGWTSSRSSADDWTTPEQEYDYVSTWVEERWATADEVVTGEGF